MKAEQDDGDDVTVNVGANDEPRRGSSPPAQQDDGDGVNVNVGANDEPRRGSSPPAQRNKRRGPYTTEPLFFKDEPPE